MKTVYLLFLIFPSLCLSQGEANQSVFTNTTTLEIFANKESNYSNQAIVVNEGFGIELSTFNGVFVFKTLSISLGVGIAFNVKDDYKSIPIVGDVKWYLKEYGFNSPYILLNAGKSLNISGFSKGYSSKLGIGYTFESDYSVQYVVEAFVKSKDFLMIEETNSNYLISSIGLSLGFKL